MKDELVMMKDGMTGHPGSLYPGVMGPRNGCPDWRTSVTIIIDRNGGIVQMLLFTCSCNEQRPSNLI